jgi:hypothetical protein
VAGKDTSCTSEEITEMPEKQLSGGGMASAFSIILLCQSGIGIRVSLLLLVTD